MKHQRAPGPALALGALLSLTLTAWVLFVLPGPAARNPFWRDSARAQEPPSPPSLWLRASALLSRKQADSDRDALRQASLRLGVPAWHQANLLGSGVKVAVLDSGFMGYRWALGKVLPANVLVRSFRRDGRLEARASQHGILCAEVIHHLAPQAELLFANWEPETPSSFLEAVRWARSRGAQVISCSMIMPSWSDSAGGGATHRALREALGDGLFFASAGNTALRHWGGPVSPGQEGWHQWARGKTDNTLRPLSDGRISVELTSADTADYELVVRDTTRGNEVARVRSARAGGYSTAVVRFEPRPDHRYAVRLRLASKELGKAARFHLTVLGGRLQYATKHGSVPFPGDGPEVIAVGAVDEHGARHRYSSCGPCPGAPKPELTAVVPFPSVWRPEQPFSGTSAAAPQAAALAALLWSRHPDWTAERVRAELRQAAGTGGHSVETGFGMVRLPAPR